MRIAMAAATPASLTTAKGPGKMSPLVKRERRWGLLFLSPWIIGFIVFFAGPMIASLILSFTDYQQLQPDAIRFIGLGNWTKMISDKNVSDSLLVTGRFLLILVPL